MRILHTTAHEIVHEHIGEKGIEHFSLQKFKADVLQALSNAERDRSKLTILQIVAMHLSKLSRAIDNLSAKVYKDYICAHFWVVQLKEKYTPNDGLFITQII